MRNIFLISSLLFFLSCKDSVENKGTEGKYKVNIVSTTVLADTFYLKQIIGSNLKTVDSIIITDKKEFSVEGKLDEAAFFSLQSKKTKLYSFFAIDNEPITIYLDQKELLFVKSYSGAALNTFLKKIDKTNTGFQQITDSLNQLYIMYANTSPVAGKAVMEKYKTESVKFNDEIKNLIRTNIKSIVSVYATEFLNKDQEFSFLDSLSTDLKALNSTSDYVSAFIKNIDKFKNTNIGNIATNFTLDTPDRNKISLADYKGKYTLIDFWASWCGPCRKENPALVKVYQKYKDKNFAILGVSLDDDLLKWKNAIAADGLSWKHVSDLKGWENKVAVMYGVESIPQSFLLDTEGKIIAKSIRSDELDVLLNKLLK